MKFIARHDGNESVVEVERQGTGYRVKLGDRDVLVNLVAAGPYVRSMRLEDGTQLSLIHHRDGNTHAITFADQTLRIEIVDPLSLKRRREDEAATGGTIKALMPGRIVRVLVNKGDVVRKGAGLLILEAMKMENEIQAPADGTVEELFVTQGQTVESGADLAKVV